MRVLVCVHGACLHAAGYSDKWWAAIGPWTEGVYGEGRLGIERIEVLWSDLISPNGQPGPWAGCMAAFFQYLDDMPTRLAIIGRFVDTVQPLLDEGYEVDLIAHSEGTIVSYEGLRQIARSEAAPGGHVANYFTLGAALGFQYGPLSTDNVRNRLLPENADGELPIDVEDWWNLVTVGDPFGAQLAPAYAVTQDFINLPAPGCGLTEWDCAHEAYFNPTNLAITRDIIGAKITGITSEQPRATGG